MPGKLLSLIADVMEVDAAELDESSTCDSLEKWDSEREVEIALSLEHAYRISISDEEMNRLRSVREIRTVLAAHGITDP